MRSRGLILVKTLDYFFLSVSVCTLELQSAAELEKRKENFSKELDFVFADVVCDFTKATTSLNFVVCIPSSGMSGLCSLFTAFSDVR